MKIQYKPWEKLEIKALTAYPTAEEFMQAATSNVPSNAAGVASFFWGNGVLFRFQALAAGQVSEALVQRFLKGEVVWESVEAAPMPKYEPEFRLADKPMMLIRIQNVSVSSLFEPVTVWLRERLGVSSRKRRVAGE